MDLTGVRLVVLSACESGRTTRLVTDQMVSFSSGLLGAGARGVVATGWEIDDPAAAMLMLRFYHAWRVEGAAPPAALHQARIWLRDTTNQEKTYFCKTLLPEFGGNGTFVRSVAERGRSRHVPVPVAKSTLTVPTALPERSTVSTATG